MLPGLSESLPIPTQMPACLSTDDLERWQAITQKRHSSAIRQLSCLRSSLKKSLKYQHAIEVANTQQSLFLET